MTPSLAPKPGPRAGAGRLTERLRGWISPKAMGGAPVDPSPRPNVPKLLALNPPHGAFADLEARLADDAPQIRVLGAQRGGKAPEGWLALPADLGRRGALRWLTDQSPSVVLSFGPITPDPMLEALIEAEIPTIIAGVPAIAQTHLRHQKDRRAIRTALGAIRVAFAEDADAVRSLRAIAPAQARVELLGPIVALPDPPACSSAERDDMAQSLRARPVWLAAFPDPDELAAVLAAHRTLLRSSHRLLLLIAIEDERGGSAMAGQLRAEGWRVARRGVEGEPDDTTEIFVADAADEIGLWYRLAPVTFLGGSLSGARLADPSGPASLGSALVAGPNRGDAPRAEAADLLKRLSSVGGLRSVAEGDELPSTIAELLVPDRAAALAHAAWDVVSDGARVQDRLVAEVADALRHVVE